MSYYNRVIAEKEVRDGLYQVIYKNGLTLSIGSSELHNSHHQFNIPITVEVAIMYTNSDGFIELTSYDSVAQITIGQFDHLCRKMTTLPLDVKRAAKEMHLYFEKAFEESL